MEKIPSIKQPVYESILSNISCSYTSQIPIGGKGNARPTLIRSESYHSQSRVNRRCISTKKSVKFNSELVLKSLLLLLTGVRLADRAAGAVKRLAEDFPALVTIKRECFDNQILKKAKESSGVSLARRMCEV